MCPEFGSGQSAPASLPGRAQGACSYMSPAPSIVDHLKKNKKDFAPFVARAAPRSPSVAAPVCSVSDCSFAAAVAAAFSTNAAPAYKSVAAPVCSACRRRPCCAPLPSCPPGGHGRPSQVSASASGFQPMFGKR